MVVAYEQQLSNTTVREANPLPATSALDLLAPRGARRVATAADAMANPLDRASAGAPIADSAAATTDRGVGQPSLGDQHFKLLARWRGRVTGVGEDTFWAALEDMDRPQAQKRDVEIYLTEVGSADRELVREGAVFYWSIGYSDTLGGQRTRQSAIRFQRRPGWTVDDQRAAESWAARMKRLVERV